jgi:hypothetical protein
MIQKDFPRHPRITRKSEEESFGEVWERFIIVRLNGSPLWDFFIISAFRGFRGRFRLRGYGSMQSREYENSHGICGLQKLLKARMRDGTISPATPDNVGSD